LVEFARVRGIGFFPALHADAIADSNVSVKLGRAVFRAILDEDDETRFGRQSHFPLRAGPGGEFAGDGFQTGNDDIAVERIEKQSCRSSQGFAKDRDRLRFGANPVGNTPRKLGCEFIAIDGARCDNAVPDFDEQGFKTRIAGFLPELVAEPIVPPLHDDFGHCVTGVFGARCC